MSVPIYFDEILLDNSLFSLGDSSGGPEYANANLRNPQTGVMSVVSTNLSGDSVTLYESDGSTARVITIPFVAYLAGVVQSSGFTISNTTGILHFTSAPGMGVEVKVDYQFDVPMRWWQNSFQ